MIKKRKKSKFVNVIIAKRVYNTKNMADIIVAMNGYINTACNGIYVPCYEWNDKKQECVLSLLKSTKKWKSKRSAYPTFIFRCMVNKLKSLAKASQAQKRKINNNMLSLSPEHMQIADPQTETQYIDLNDYHKN